MISLVNPQFFWVMVVPLAIFSYLILTHKDNFLQIFDEKVLERLSVGDNSLPLVMRNLVMILSIFLMIVAMGRPVIDHGDKTITLEGLDAVVALDISGSMRTKDIYPNRLEFAKKKMLTLFDEMPTDELCLVAFAHATFALAPFSSDKVALRQIIEGVDDAYINMSSTNFRALGAYTAQLLKEKKNKILILFSDGGDPKNIASFAKIIKTHQITLYLVLVGTKKGAPVLNAKEKPLKDPQGKIIITQRNDSLGAVALESNGAFVIAQSGNSEIKNIVKVIKDHHQDQEQGEITIHNREEYFYYPLGVGILLMLFGFISFPRGLLSQKSIG
jgi:Ca-activated chloride channel family protein